MSDISPWPSTGRLLGVDYGTLRVGLAVTDPGRVIASPLNTYARRDDAADAAYFRSLCAAERVVALVVGLAVHANGDEGIKAKECRAYGSWLTGVTGLPIAFWDERYTSMLAEEAMRAAGLSPRKRKDRVDRVAAQFILQSYMEAGCPPPPPAGGADG